MHLRYRSKAQLLQLGFWFFLGCGAKQAPAPEPEPVEKPPPICALESPDLCLQDGIDLWAGNGREVDRDAARAKFELACSGGLARGCTYLGIALKDLDDISRARAFDLFASACDQGEMMSCAQLGSEYLVQAWVKHERTGEPETAAFVSANELLRRACVAEENEDTIATWGFSVRGFACGGLASSYENGFALPQDYGLALDLNRQSCELGWLRSCAQIGFFYENGLGVEANAEEAAAHYANACDQGDAMGCNNLGLLLKDSDPETSATALKKACDASYPGSCEALEPAP